MKTVEAVLLKAMVKLVRQVPWGPTRDELEARASRLSSEASYEAGMADNYSTAADLRWRAAMHHLAAQARFPREGDTYVRHYRADLLRELVHKLKCDERDDDVGAWTEASNSGCSYALAGTFSDDMADTLIDELAAAGRIDDPEYYKQAYREDVEAEAAYRASLQAERNATYSPW